MTGAEARSSARADPGPVPCRPYSWAAGTSPAAYARWTTASPPVVCVEGGAIGRLVVERWGVHSQFGVCRRAVTVRHARQFLPPSPRGRMVLLDQPHDRQPGVVHRDPPPVQYGQALVPLQQRRRDLGRLRARVERQHQPVGQAVQSARSSRPLSSAYSGRSENRYRCAAARPSPAAPLCPRTSVRTGRGAAPGSAAARRAVARRCRHDRRRSPAVPDDDQVTVCDGLC